MKLFEGQFLNLYRQTYDTPYMNRNDNRITPNTFEGYSLQGTVGGKDGGTALRYGVGYMTKIKERTSDMFVSMSRQAGAAVDRGVGVLGALFSHGEASIGAIDYYSEDIINIGYAEAKYVWSLPHDVGVLFAAQYTDERSVGGDLLQKTPLPNEHELARYAHVEQYGKPGHTIQDFRLIANYDFSLF